MLMADRLAIIYHVMAYAQPNDEDLDLN